MVSCGHGTIKIPKKYEYLFEHVKEKMYMEAKLLRDEKGIIGFSLDAKKIMTEKPLLFVTVWKENGKPRIYLPSWTKNLYHRRLSRISTDINYEVIDDEFIFRIKPIKNLTYIFGSTKNGQESHSKAIKEIKDVLKRWREFQILPLNSIKTEIHKPDIIFRHNSDVYPIEYIQSTHSFRFDMGSVELELSSNKNIKKYFIIVSEGVFKKYSRVIERHQEGRNNLKIFDSIRSFEKYLVKNFL